MRFLLSLLYLLLPGLLGAEGFTGWQRTSTEHFVFVYEKRDRAVVAELRSFAEDVYTKVTRFFGSYPKRIWVVVDGRVDTANGYYTGGIFPSHLVLYVTSPSVPVLGSTERQYLRVLLAHELTHYVHLNYDRGFFATLSNIFGPGIESADSFFLPDWMKEGVAVNNETMFTEGGRGRDPFFEMEYRALVLENRFFSLKQAAYESAFPPQDRVYLGGYLFVHYLLQRYGTDTFAKIQRRFARFPLFGPWAAIEAVTGTSAKRLYQDMLRELRRQYARLSNIPAGKLLSPDRIGDYHLPVLTAGGWYEYRSNLDSPPAIVKIDPTSGKERVLLDTSLTDYTSLASDHGGTKLVYASFDVTLGPSGTVATSDLFALDPSTRRVRRITVGEHLWQPALSPDGRTLVAVQGRGSFSRLVLVDERMGKVTALFERPETNVFNPAFSPNGRLLTFALNDHGRERIMVLSLARAPGAGAGTLPARPLPDAPETNAFFPSFAGNGHVVFVADLGAGLALYETALAGGQLYRVAVDPVGVSAGLINDGRVIYTSYAGTGTVLREKPVEHIAVSRVPTHKEGIAKVPRANGAETPIRSGRADEIEEGAVHGTRYVDRPRPLFWLPLPFYDYAPAYATGFPIGFGAALFGASVLERSRYALGLSFRTDVLQPSVNLSITSMLGRNSLSYTLVEGYASRTQSAYVQLVAQSLELSIPLVAERITGATTTLSLTPGVSDALSIQGNRPFSVLAPFGDPQSFYIANQYSLDLGLSYSHSRDAPPRAIYPPKNIRLSIQGSYAPPSAAASGLTSSLTGSVSVPSLFRNQVLRFGLKNSYSTFGGQRATTIHPRGLFLSRGASGDPVYEQSTPARSIVAADYLFNLALLDGPLPLGLNLQGLAMGLHVATAFDWNPRNGAFEPDHSLYAGAEIVALLGYQAGGTVLPFGVGISVRFDPTFSRPFDPLHDIGPYFFFGTNSFASSGLSSSAALEATDRRGALAPF